jgi:hypothetical protein
MPNGVGTGIFQGRAVAEDYGVWRAHFGESVLPSAAGLLDSVPEPASILLAMWTLALSALRRHG